MKIFSLISVLEAYSLPNAAPVFCAMVSINVRYKLFIPGSLNCEAIVPNTGI